MNQKLNYPHHAGCQNMITMHLPEGVHLSYGFKNGIFDKQQFPSIMHSEMEILLARCKDL